MILLPQKTKVTKKDEFRAVIEVPGLYPGYGITIGNSLRRVLLSSLEGAAVTQAKIKNVSHEFSTIPGILEDAVFILLNLKKLRFKMHSPEPQKAILKVSGQKKAKGSDFKVPSQIELINKDAHIATLTGKTSSLEIEIQIEKGMGYESVESAKTEKGEMGIIYLDAIYSPIKKVSFHVEDMRVGDRTDFDRLTLDIETDGTLDPEKAFKDACSVLIQHFSLLEEKEEVKPETKKKEVKKVETQGTKTKIEDLSVSERTKNILLENSIKSVGGLVRKSEKDVLDLKGMGDKGVKEIKKALKKLDLELK